MRTNKKEGLSEFFMVMREGGGSPIVRHKTRKEADAEAKRLSQKQPGEVFYVLRAESYFTAVITAPRGYWL